MTFDLLIKNGTIVDGTGRTDPFSAGIGITGDRIAAVGNLEGAWANTTIDATGQYFINDKQLLKSTPKALRNALFQAAGTTKEPSVVIYADAKTPHQAVVHVMDAARRLGYMNLTFATQQPAAPDDTP